MTLATVSRYDPEQIPEQSGRAVVVGAGMAGLVTARVLADAFSEVTVIDRDSFPTEPIPRRGVPQGAQPHALWESGRTTLEDLFPGFSEELLEAGGMTSELETLDTDFMERLDNLDGSEARDLLDIENVRSHPEVVNSLLRALN